MRAAVVFVVVALCRTVLCDSTFRFGAVLSTEGSTSRVAQAKQGFELYFATVNESNDGRGFLVKGKPETKGFYFKYDFLRKEDFNDKEKHKEEVKRLLKEDKIHFLGGSLPEYADIEMQLANESDTLLYHCCLAPDSFYKPEHRTSFGISASNANFTKLLLRKLKLENVNRIMVLYDEDDEFSKTTCLAAVDQSELPTTSQADGAFLLEVSYKESEATEEDHQSHAQRVKEERFEALIACIPPESEKILATALHKIQYPLKALYMTVGPARQWWVDSLDPPKIANDILSSAQWHQHMKYGDKLFNSTKQYVTMYKNMFNGNDPDDNAAAASAVGVTLTMAIQNAFASCDISKTNGDADSLLFNSSAITCDDGLNTIGNDRILDALAALEEETFFGKVEFDINRRNVGLHPVTTQVFERTLPGNNTHREIEPILPFGYATELFKFPAQNRYRKQCEPGYSKASDTFAPCEPCLPGESSEDQDADHCNSCPIGEWNDEKGQRRCKKCPSGSYTEGTGSSKVTDCICMENYFSQNGLMGVQCDPCPNGAICPGNVENPIPVPGYWSNESFPGEVYQCDGGSVCIGGNSSACKEGYSGRLCADCDDGYFSITQECFKCFKSEIIILLCFSLLIAWYLLNVIVSQSVASLEMILSWAQLANIIGDIDLNWTKMLRRTFEIANILDFDVDILEPSCLVPWCYMNNFVVQLCLPFVMTSMALIGYIMSFIVYQLISRKWIKFEDSVRDVVALFVEVPESKEDLAKKWNATIATLLASVDVTYVTIAKYCFDCFKCKKIGGVSVMSVAPGIECGSNDHKTLIVVASLGIVFYVFGFLAFVSWKLYDLHQQRSFASEVNLTRFGFLYRKYELDYYYTPAIAMVRKVLFVLVLVFMNNPAFQIGTIAIVINASLMIHVYTAPYVETYLDVLFNFLLLALMFEAFGGLMFYSENLPSQNRTILEWIVMSTLFLLICVFLVIFVMETTRLYHMRYLKAKHKDYAREEHGYSSTGLLDTVRRLRNRSRILKRSISIHSGSSKDDKDNGFELLDTLHPHFVYRCLRKRPDFIHDWDRLTNILKNYMSDQSETSYLSMEPSAKFWRKLVDRFPELIDFLAVADTQARESFNDFATNLYRNFYLSKKVTPLPLMGVLNWRDYAPMAQWLAIAPDDDRRFFIDFVSEMFRTIGDNEAADMLERKLESGGDDPRLLMIQARRVSKKKQYIIDNLSQGSNPFTHSASSSDALSSAASVAIGVAKFCRGLNRNISLASVEERSMSRIQVGDNNSVNLQTASREMESIDLNFDKAEETDLKDSQTILEREKSSNAMLLNNQTSFNSERSGGKSVSFSPEISNETNSSDEEED